jgi:replicative DNA helicase
MEYKTPPHDENIEKALLGCIISDPSKFNLVNSIFNDRDNVFYKTLHNHIYKSIKDLMQKDNTFDLNLLYSQIKRYDDDITMSYLIEIEFPNGMLAEKYAEIVLEHFNARQTIKYCQQAISSIYNGEELLYITGDLRSKLDKTIIDPKNRYSSNIAEDALQTWETYLDETESKHKNIIHTGWIDIDKVITMKKSHHILIGARTAMGKTSFALNLATNIALQGKRPVFFSMEQSKETMIECYISQISGVSRINFMKGQLSDFEIKRVHDNASIWGSNDIMDIGIYEGTYSPMEIRHKLIVEMKDKPVDVVIIDFLHAMKPPVGYKRDGHEWLREATKQLEELAIELNIVIVTLAQLNRSVDTREDKRPVMTDIREAGEDHADIILFIYRDEYYNPDTSEPGVAEIIIAKQRHGRTGKIKLRFIDYSTAFINITEKEKEAKIQDCFGYKYHE